VSTANVELVVGYIRTGDVVRNDGQTICAASTRSILYPADSEA
jgi:hypothetical protein